MHRIGLQFSFVVCSAIFQMADGEFWDECAPWPDNDSGTLLIAWPRNEYQACDECNSLRCWINYLRWERANNVTLNAKHYHLVDEYDAELEDDIEDVA